MADSLSSDSWSGCSVHRHQYSLLLQVYGSPDSATMSHYTLQVYRYKAVEHEMQLYSEVV